MKKFKYDICYDSSIRKHEQQMYKKYQDIIKIYEKKFLKCNVTVKYNISWRNFLNDIISLEQLAYINGYRCDFLVGFERDGKAICYDIEEGATLGANFNISSITRSFFGLNVILCTETDDFIKEMEYTLEIVSNLQATILQ